MTVFFPVLRSVSITVASAMPLSAASSTIPATILSIFFSFANKLNADKPTKQTRAAVAKQRLSKGLFFLFFILDNIQHHRIRTDHFEFAAALGTVQGLTFLDIVIDVDHRLAFRTVGHKALARPIWFL